jgi:hypothetical protein
MHADKNILCGAIIRKAVAKRGAKGILLTTKTAVSIDVSFCQTIKVAFFSISSAQV